jgi:hypothetical protein
MKLALEICGVILFIANCSGLPASTGGALVVGGTHTFRVTSFGAKGLGTGDDAGAIRRAITAAARAGGGQVIFPCGEFPVQSIAETAPGGRSLLYERGADGVHLVGQGRCTHLYTTLPQKTVMEFEDSEGVAVSRLRITAQNAIYVETYGMDGGSAIRYTGVTHGLITQVEVDGAAAGALYLTKGTSNSTVSHNFIHDTYGSGIWEDDCGAASATTCSPNRPPSHNLYDANTLTDTSLAMPTAMTVDDGGASSYATLRGNFISWTRAPLLGHERIFCIQVGNSSDVDVLSNTCTGSPYAGIVVTTGGSLPSRHVTIQGNTIRSAGSVKAGGSGIVLYDDPRGAGISFFIIADNTIVDAMDHGILLDSAWKQGGIHDGAIRNNVIRSAAQRSPGAAFGIQVNRGASVAITENTIACDGTCVTPGIAMISYAGSDIPDSTNHISGTLGSRLLIR